MSVAILARGCAGVFSERLGEMALRGEAEILTYGEQALIGISEQPLCLLRLFRKDKIRESHTRLLLEAGGKVSAADKHSLSHLLDAGFLRYISPYVR